MNKVYFPQLCKSVHLCSSPCNLCFYLVPESSHIYASVIVRLFGLHVQFSFSFNQVLMISQCPVKSRNIILNQISCITRSHFQSLVFFPIFYDCQEQKMRGDTLDQIVVEKFLIVLVVGTRLVFPVSNTPIPR